jgi:hypothetical protein
MDGPGLQRIGQCATCPATLELKNGATRKPAYLSPANGKQCGCQTQTDKTSLVVAGRLQVVATSTSSQWTLPHSHPPACSRATAIPNSSTNSTGQRILHARVIFSHAPGQRAAINPQNVLNISKYWFIVFFIDI